MKKEIQVFDYSEDILKAVSSGVLLTTKAGDKVNSMTISWGTLGIEWAEPIFTVFVREGRFTRNQLDKNPEFTISIPIGNFNRKILGFCGTKSGRNTDKAKELGLTLETPDKISVPGIRELPLTLECEVIYKQNQDRDTIPEGLKAKFYPQDVDSSFYDCNKDFHIAYYGKIVSAYIIE